jgi:hypothetical protein
MSIISSSASQLSSLSDLENKPTAMLITVENVALIE